MKEERTSESFSFLFFFFFSKDDLHHMLLVCVTKLHHNDPVQSDPDIVEIRFCFFPTTFHLEPQFKVPS